MDTQTPQMDPSSIICVIKNSDGKEVGRIAATAANATLYINELGRHYGSLTIDYEQDSDAAMISRMLSRPMRF